MDGDAGTGDAVDVEGRAAEVAGAVARRADRVVEALRSLDEADLLGPSALPGWSRLTIACHLRYGAEAAGRLTRATTAGMPATYYPGGRERVRPATLTPRPGEEPGDVVASLGHASTELGRLWSGVTADQWRLAIREPDGVDDMGTISLGGLAILRLTEVEVHGSDLALDPSPDPGPGRGSGTDPDLPSGRGTGPATGLRDWSGLFVEVALPFRLDRLNTRRTNHRDVDEDMEGSWLLVATDGPAYRVTVAGGTVESHPAGPGTPAEAVIEASTRDLLALLLGRPLNEAPRYGGDTDLARAFPRAFPGP